MKKLFILLFLLSATTANAKEYKWKVIRVVDGDTLKVQANFLPEELDLSVRVKNVDTPEKRGKCDKEKNLAISASAFTINLIQKSKTITFSELEWDKYGGRVLAIVKVDKKDLSKLLIDAGFAREYHGEKKSDWCN